MYMNLNSNNVGTQEKKNRKKSNKNKNSSDNLMTNHGTIKTAKVILNCLFVFISLSMCNIIVIGLCVQTTV